MCSDTLSLLRAQKTKRFGRIGADPGVDFGFLSAAEVEPCEGGSLDLFLLIARLRLSVAVERVLNEIDSRRLS